VKRPLNSPPDDLKLIGWCRPCLGEEIARPRDFHLSSTGGIWQRLISINWKPPSKQFGRIRRDDWIGQAREPNMGKNTKKQV
jgi:hypothetical protein